MQYSKVPNTMVRLNNCEVWVSDFYFNMQQMRRVFKKRGVRKLFNGSRSMTIINRVDLISPGVGLENYLKKHKCPPAPAPTPPPH